jgi:hypothetical protein
LDTHDFSRDFVQFRASFDSARKSLVFLAQRSAFQQIRTIAQSLFQRPLPRQRRISSWLPDIKGSGTAIPRNSAGRV